MCLLFLAPSRPAGPSPEPPTPKTDLAPSLSPSCPCARVHLPGCAYRTQCQTNQLAASLVPRNARPHPHTRLPVCPVCSPRLSWPIALSPPHLSSPPEQSPLHSLPRTAHQPCPEHHPHFSRWHFLPSKSPGRLSRSGLFLRPRLRLRQLDRLTIREPTRKSERTPLDSRHRQLQATTTSDPATAVERPLSLLKPTSGQLDSFVPFIHTHNTLKRQVAPCQVTPLRSRPNSNDAVVPR